MAEFKFEHESHTTNSEFQKEISEVGTNYDLLIKKLVKESRKFVVEINKRHKGLLKVNLWDAPRNFSDLAGWTLDINQVYVNEEWGFMKEDKFLGLVARIEIEEVKFTKGLPKLTVKEWLENGEMKFDQTGFSRNIKPEWVPGYLQHILETGNARPQILKVL